MSLRKKKRRTSTVGCANQKRRKYSAILGTSKSFYGSSPSTHFLNETAGFKNQLPAVASEIRCRLPPRRHRFDGLLQSRNYLRFCFFRSIFARVEQTIKRSLKKPPGFFGGVIVESVVFTPKTPSIFAISRDEKEGVTDTITYSQCYAAIEDDVPSSGRR